MRARKPDKQQAEALALELIEWADTALRYLDWRYWTFHVDRKGRYLPGKQLVEPCPIDFFRTLDQLQIRFRVPPGRRTARRCEVQDVQKDVFRCVWITAKNLSAGKTVTAALRKLADRHDFKPYRKPKG